MTVKKFKNCVKYFLRVSERIVFQQYRLTLDLLLCNEILVWLLYLEWLKNKPFNKKNLINLEINANEFYYS